MIHSLVMYAISALALIFGLLALLKQKTYIDAETHRPTEVDLPFLGKLKTNYPALVFVVLSFVLAHGTFDKSYPAPEIEWRISGTLETPGGEDFDWRSGHFSVFPESFAASLSQNGTFQIDAKIEAGTSFEDFFETLSYDHDEAAGSIDLKAEYEKFKAGEESLIQSATERTRTFKPIVVTQWAQP